MATRIGSECWKHWGSSSLYLPLCSFFFVVLCISKGQSLSPQTASVDELLHTFYHLLSCLSPLLSNPPPPSILWPPLCTPSFLTPPPPPYLHFTSYTPSCIHKGLPLDFLSPAFYKNRQSAVDERLKWIASATTEVRPYIHTYIHGWIALASHTHYTVSCKEWLCYECWS